jgi:hypothetical protein
MTDAAERLRRREQRHKRQRRRAAVAALSADLDRALTSLEALCAELDRCEAASARPSSGFYRRFARLRWDHDRHDEHWAILSECTAQEVYKDGLLPSHRTYCLVSASNEVGDNIGWIDHRLAELRRNRGRRAQGSGYFKCRPGRHLMGRLSAGFSHV